MLVGGWMSMRAGLFAAAFTLHFCRVKLIPRKVWLESDLTCVSVPMIEPCVIFSQCRLASCRYTTFFIVSCPSKWAGLTVVGLRQGTVLNYETRPCCLSKYCLCVRVKLMLLLSYWVITWLPLMGLFCLWFIAWRRLLYLSCPHVSNSFNTYLTLNI